MYRITILTLAIAALSAAPTMAAPQSIQVTLLAQNGSGEHGIATLVQQSDGVHITIQLKGEPSGLAQPMHIHSGKCAHINPVPAYALKNVVGGTSTTVVSGISLKDLLAKPYAINVHKSANDLGTYVACGEIGGS